MTRSNNAFFNNKKEKNNIHNFFSSRSDRTAAAVHHFAYQKHQQVSFRTGLQIQKPVVLDCGVDIGAKQGHGP